VNINIDILLDEKVVDGFDIFVFASVGRSQDCAYSN